MKIAVFVSGPYSGNVQENVKNAIDMSNKLIDRNILPLCPHLWSYCDERQPRDYNTWLQLAFELMLRSDAVIVLPGESPGRDKEVQFASDNGIPVFYSLSELDETMSVDDGKV